MERGGGGEGEGEDGCYGASGTSATGGEDDEEVAEDRGWAAQTGQQDEGVEQVARFGLVAGA